MTNRRQTVQIWDRVFALKRPRQIHRNIPRFRPHLEEIERRVVPARFDWTGAHTENWFNKWNWAQEAVPANNGTDDIYIGAIGADKHAPLADIVDLDLNSLHLTSTTPLTLDRVNMTLRNGGEMTDPAGKIYKIDSTGGAAIGSIILAGGTFTWTGGTINPGLKSAVFQVNPGALLDINLEGRTLTLGDQLHINGGTVNIVGGANNGSTFVMGNGRGVTNAGTLNITYDLTIERNQGGATNLNQAFINNYSNRSILFRDGAVTCQLPVANSGTFRVFAETKPAAVSIINTNPSTGNVTFSQSSGQTLIEAKGFNATLEAYKGYAATGGALRGLASGATVTPKLSSGDGAISLGGPNSAVSLYSGDREHIDTTFALNAQSVTFGQGTNATWYWKKVGGVASYSKISVQGALTVSNMNTSANLDVVSGSPVMGEQASVLTSTGTFTGTFGNFMSGGWRCMTDNANKRFYFLAM